MFSAGLADQVVLSLGSILVLLLGARSYTPYELGAYSAGLITFQMVTVVLRSLTGESLIVVGGAATGGDGHDRDCLQFSLLVPLLGLPVAAGLLLVGGDLVRPIGAGLAISAVVCFQDTVRFVYLRRGATGATLRMDAVVVGAQVVLVGLLVHQGVGPTTVVLFLGVPPGLAAARYWAGAGLRLSLGSARRWYLQSRELSRTYFYEAVLGAALQWATFAAVAALASVGDAAAFRSLTAIFGLTNVVVNFLRANFLAHMVGGATGPVRDTRFGTVLRDQVLVMVGLIVGTIVASYAVLVLLPTGVGSQLLGDTWELSRNYLLVGAFSRLLTTLTVVPYVVLRAQKVTWRAARVRTVVGVTSVAVVPLAVSVAGVDGAFVSSAVMSLVMVVALTRLVDWDATSRRP